MQQLNKLALAAIALAALTLPTAARAQNLLSNGSFETVINGTDWASTGNIDRENYPFAFGGNPSGALGNLHAIFNRGGSDPNATLSQTFATAPGVAYEVRFNFGIYGNEMLTGTQNMLAEAVDVSSTLVIGSLTATESGPTRTDPAVTMGTPYSFLFTATGTQTTLRFSDQPGDNTQDTDGLLDNVSVTVVPEAGSLALILPALSVLGAVVVRRRTVK